MKTVRPDTDPLVREAYALHWHLLDLYVRTGTPRYEDVARKVKARLDRRWYKALGPIKRKDRLRTPDQIDKPQGGYWRRRRA